MLSAGLSVTSQFTKKGFEFINDGALLNDPHAAIIALKTQMAQRDNAGIGRTLSVLSAGLECVRSTLPAGTWLSKSAVDVPAAQPVHVVNLPEPAAQTVHVVSLPARQTTTEMTRDKDGNIVSAAQVERDLPMAA